MGKQKVERPEERPLAPMQTTVDLGRLVGELRRAMAIRQAELARRAAVGRHWIIAFEQGKPTLEIGLVLRTLQTLGFELLLRPTDPLPPWIVRAKTDADHRRLEADRRRAARRHLRRRAIARQTRLTENSPTVWPDLR